MDTKIPERKRWWKRLFLHCFANQKTWLFPSHWGRDVQMQTDIKMNTNSKWEVSHWWTASILNILWCQHSKVISTYLHDSLVFKVMIRTWRFISGTWWHHQKNSLGMYPFYTLKITIIWFATVSASFPMSHDFR